MNASPLTPLTTYHCPRKSTYLNNVKRVRWKEREQPNIWDVLYSEIQQIQAKCW